MTPFHLFRETPTRSRSWPPYAYAIVVGAGVAMFIAVTLTAWQLQRTPAAYVTPTTTPTIELAWPSTAEIRTRMEVSCDALETMRAQRTGLYAPEQAR